MRRVRRGETVASVMTSGGRPPPQQVPIRAPPGMEDLMQKRNPAARPRIWGALHRTAANHGWPAFATEPAMIGSFVRQQGAQEQRS